MKRELSEDELSTTGVKKMLIEELDRVDQENSDLKQYRDKFYDVQKDKAVLESRLTVQRKMELISTGCIAVGAAALVYVPEAWQHQPDGWICLVFGMIATTVGTVAKAVKA